MGLRIAIPSLLLSIVVVVPCMRKQICAPSEQPAISAPVRVQSPGPVAPVKPASATPNTAKPNNPHRDMHANERVPRQSAGHSG